MSTLICPQCHRTLGQKESLMVTHDAVGTLIVHHMIPADAGTNPFSDFDRSSEWLKDELSKSKVKDVYPSTPMRDWCSSAGFKEVIIR